MVFPGVSDPPSLEALACHEALSLASDLNLGRLAVVSDCKRVITDIREGTGGQYASIIREIILHKSMLEDATFSFEGRKSNNEAHLLARHALALGPGRHLWLLEPHDRVLIPVTLSFDQ
jgi:hypothetical protein